MENLISIVTDFSNLRSLFLTGMLIVLIKILQVIFIRKISRSENIEDLEKVKIKKDIKTYLNLLLIIFLFVLWFAQLQAIFVSFLAVAAAIVVATKELIMSFMGGILIKINHHFRLGDRIEVDDTRGFVVEKNLTTTKVLEIGPEKSSQQTTGNVITIPNSVMLSKSVKNESYFKGYSIKGFTFPLPPNIKFEAFEELVLEWSNEICRDYMNEAESIMGQFCKREGLLIPAIKPRSKILLCEKGGVELLLKMPVKNHAIGDIEQELFRKYVKLLGQ